MRINLLPIQHPKESQVKLKNSLPKQDNQEVVPLETSKPNYFGINSTLIYICWGIFLLGSFIFLLGEYFNYDLAKGELISLGEQLTEYRGYLTAETEKEQKIQNQLIMQQQAELAAISHLYRPWLAIFNGFASSLPEDVWLTGVHGASQGSIIINGHSTSQTAISDYIKKLQIISLFNQVRLKEVKHLTTKIPDYLFIIEIEVGGTLVEYSEKQN